MAAENIIKHFNLSVEGQGYAGKVTEYTPPNLTLITEDFRAGGMDAAVKLDMGIEPMETSFVLSSYDPEILKLFGLKQGKKTKLTLRAAAKSMDGTVKQVKHVLNGRVTGIDRGSFAAGSVPSLTVTMSLESYEETHGGDPIYNIDIVGMKRVINGVDQLVEQRKALGLLDSNATQAG